MNDQIRKLLLRLTALSLIFPIRLAAAEIEHHRLCHIVSAIGGRYLTADLTNGVVGAPVIIQGALSAGDAFRDATQKWTLKTIGIGKHTVITHGTHLVLDVKDARPEDRAAVQLWNFGGFGAHLWELEKAEGDYYYVKNLATGKVLDVNGGVNADGTVVQMFTKNGTASQKWRFEPAQSRGYLMSVNGSLMPCRGDLQHEGDPDLRTERIVPCEAAYQDWKRIREKQYGVHAMSRNRHHIGWSAVKKSGLFSAEGRNWYPLSDKKQVHCGILDGGSFTGSSYGDGDEKDYCLYVEPKGPFTHHADPGMIGFNYTKDDLLSFDSHLIGDISLTDRCIENAHKLPGGRLAVEGEVTPDESMWTRIDPYLCVIDGDLRIDSLYRQKFGMYGPWVREAIHCNHPEIHPSEVFWWVNDAEDRIFCYLVQDDSDRFHSKSNFTDHNLARLELDGRLPGQRLRPRGQRKKDLQRIVDDTHPWVPQTLSEQVYFAFEVDTNQRSMELFDIHIEFQDDNVSTSRAAGIPARALSGKEHKITFGGRPLLKVTEHQAVDTDLGVHFEFFRGTAPTSKVYGYVVVSAAVGENTDGREGAMLFSVKRSRESLVHTPVPPLDRPLDRR